MQNTHIDPTQLHPLGLAAVLVAGVLTLLLPRKYAVVPILVLVCTVATSQRVVLATLDFTLLRLLVLTGWVRLLVRNELTPFKWLPIDTCLALSGFIATVTFVALIGRTNALVMMLGQLMDTVGLYYLFRFLVRDWQDLRRIVLCFVCLSLPLAVGFVIEKATSRNLFSLLGGVRPITLPVQSRLRAQGPFEHPIIAGCFWASLLPLMSVLFLTTRQRLLVALGILATCVIILMTWSSTPVAAIFFGLLGFSFYPIRSLTRWFFWATVLTLIGLHFYMKAPVWHLISRIDLVGGSSGYHRYILIDNAIRNFDKWWLCGTLERNFIFAGFNDTTNHYLALCFRGGISSCLAFMAVLAAAFLTVGRLLHATRADPSRQLMSWALGVCMFQHTLSLLAVFYFGQAVVMLHLQFALIGSMGSWAWQHVSSQRAAQRQAAASNLVNARARGASP